MPYSLRTGSRLIHISTISIAGLSVDGVPGPDVKLSEQTLWLGQNIDENKYVYSKFKAEELVLDAIAHHGLNAKSPISSTAYPLPASTFAGWKKRSSNRLLTV